MCQIMFIFDIPFPLDGINNEDRRRRIFQAVKLRYIPGICNPEDS